MTALTGAAVPALFLCAIAIAACSDPQVAQCPEGFTVCDDTCADLRVDLANCGACGEACADGSVCDGNGACALSCQAGLVACGDTCRNPDTDRAYCGATTCVDDASDGDACADGFVCDGAGGCALSCQAGLVDCGGTCVNPDTDRNFCGATTCADDATDGVVCDDGYVCDGAGDCAASCQLDLTDCSGVCTDTDTDEAHCGACDDAACTTDQVCVVGVCSLVCLGGTTACDGRCADVDVDPEHCGDCGRSCGDDEYCVGGSCTLLCGEGLLACDDDCLDVSSDPANCGSCDHACATSERCVTGTCVAYESCKKILDAGASIGSGVYWIDPDGTGTGAALQVYCDMTSSGGGWTKLENTTYPAMFSAGTWPSLNGANPLSNPYSILGMRGLFADTSSCYELRLTVGDVGGWLGTPTQSTDWRQCHDPFTQTTNGSDYTFLGGVASTTCGGFNGLHARYQGYSYASDADSVDAVGCWWMQVVPHTNYNGLGYTDGYGGSGNYHQWQALWVR